MEVVKERERKEIEKREKEREKEREQERERERERERDQEKEKEDDDSRMSDLIFTPRKASGSTAAPIEAPDPTDLRYGFHR